MTRKIEKPNKFGQIYKGVSMSCFVTAATRAKCRDCGGTSFKKYYDRRLKENIPICSDCDGDPNKYRVAYTIKQNGKSQKIYRASNLSGESLDDPVKAIAFLNFVKEKIKDDGDSFNIKTVGTSTQKKSLLIKNYMKNYLLEREGDVENGTLTPGGYDDINLNCSYIVEIFGEYEIGKITYSLVQKELAKAKMKSVNKRTKRRDRLSQARKRAIVHAFKVVLKYASREGDINGVPELPVYKNITTSSKKQKFYNLKEVELILNNIKHPTAKVALFIIATYAKRRGEVECLTWGDVCFDSETISFNKHISRGKLGHKVLPGLKSSPEKELVYSFHRDVKKALMQMATISLDYNELIFKSPKGKMLAKNFLYNEWRESVEELMQKKKRNGKPVLDRYFDVHRGLRSSVLTSLSENGVSEDKVGELYGGDRRTLRKHYIKTQKQNTDGINLGVQLVCNSKTRSSKSLKLKDAQ